MAYRRSTNDPDDYDDEPRNRWDRDRFEQVRYERQESRPRREVLVEERPAARPRYVDERIEAPRFASRVRREVFEVAPRETSNRALQHVPRDDYERDVHIDIERRRERVESPRPGLRRRQSSLDTYDRRPQPRYERAAQEQTPPRRVRREEYLSPPRAPVAPVREEIREVEIIRDREVNTGRPRARSDVRSIISDGRSHRSRASVSSSSRATSTSPNPNRPIGKKGHTKLPKGHYKGIAVARFCEDHGISFSDEGDFFKVNRALGKDSIDKILLWSREMRESRQSDQHDHRLQLPRESERYETIRTEWINPPSVRAPSPARSVRISRARSPSPVQENIQVTTQTATGQFIPPPPLTGLPTQYVASSSSMNQPLTVAVQTRSAERTHQDIEAEIRRLELERDVIRLERGDHYHSGHQVIIKDGQEVPYNEFSVVKFNPKHHKSKSSGGGDLYYVDRVESFEPKEKKKDKKPSARAAALMMASLS